MSISLLFHSTLSDCICNVFFDVKANTNALLLFRATTEAVHWLALALLSNSLTSDSSHPLLSGWIITRLFANTAGIWVTRKYLNEPVTARQILHLTSLKYSVGAGFFLLHSIAKHVGIQDL